MKIDIDVESMRDLTRYLQGMEKRVQDFSVPLTKGAKQMLADCIEAIQTSGSSYGDPWEPMAQSTIERHGAHQLLGSLGGDMEIFVRPFVAGVFTRNPVFTLHEYGRDWPGADGVMDMPSRTILFLTEGTTDMILESLLDYAVEESGRT